MLRSGAASAHSRSVAFCARSQERPDASRAPILRCGSGAALTFGLRRLALFSSWARRGALGNCYAVRAGRQGRATDGCNCLHARCSVTQRLAWRVLRWFCGARKCLSRLAPAMIARLSRSVRAPSARPACLWCVLGRYTQPPVAHSSGLWPCLGKRRLERGAASAQSCGDCAPQ